MPNQVKPRTPSGFIEYLPAYQLEFNRLLSIIRETYELYGFAPLDTPVLELTEILLAKEAGETSRQVYSLTKGDTDLTMRFDLTVPLARYVAEHEHQLTFPFSRYAIGKVFRAERAQAGRFREFLQCDVDTIGSNSPLVDAQFPAIINEIFERFNFGEFTIRLNNRLVLNGFFEGIGVQTSSSDVLRIVDKMEKITESELVGELKAAGLNDEQAAQVLKFTAITGENDEVLAQLNALGIQNDTFRDGVTKLEALITALRTMSVPEKRFKIDLRIARGLDYYTGTVYETVLDDHPEIGSVCSGGRYDDLAGLYTKTKLPGVGISIGLSRLFYALCKIDVIKPTAQSPAKVIVMPFSDDQVSAAISVATKLRQAGIANMLYTEPHKIPKKMHYASKMGFTYAVQIGPREMETNEVTLRDMRTSESVTVGLDVLVEYING